MLFQIMVYAVLLFLFIATGFAKPRSVPQNDRPPTQSSLIAIAHWVSANSDLPDADEPPRVELVPRADLEQLRYKGLLPHEWQVVGGEHSTPRPEFRRDVVAVYDDATATIYLPTNWTAPRRPNSRCWCTRWCITCKIARVSNTHAAAPAKSPPISRNANGWGSTGWTWKRNFTSTCSPSWPCRRA